MLKRLGACQSQGGNEHLKSATHAGGSVFLAELPATCTHWVLHERTHFAAPACIMEHLSEPSEPQCTWQQTNTISNGSESRLWLQAAMTSLRVAAADRPP